MLGTTLLHRKRVRSMLGEYLRRAIDQRGWSDRHFADHSGVSPAVLSQLINTPGKLPSLETAVKLARALDVPLSRIVALCGMTVPDDAPTDADDAALLREFPELGDIVRDLRELHPQDRAAVHGYIHGRLKR